MSKQESAFIRWFGGIAGTLIVTMIVGMISFYAHTSAKAEADHVRFENIREDVKSINHDIESINEDIQEINKKLWGIE